MDYCLMALIIVLVVQQALDVYTTAEILCRGGQELNPYLARLMDKIGVINTLLITKLALGALMQFYIHVAPPSWVKWGLSLVVVFYLWVVVNNFRQLSIAKARRGW